jgi:FAD:protein FMN transferase
LNKTLVRFFIALLVIIVIISIIRLSPISSGSVITEKTEFLLDTSVTVKICAVSKQDGERILESAFEEARKIQTEMDPLKGGGELNRINEGPYDKWWAMSADLKAVVERSRHFYVLSKGKYDPTIAAVEWLWNFDSELVPSNQNIKKALLTVGLDKLKVSGDSLCLGFPGTKLDFGASIPGFVADRMTDCIKKAGVKSGLVNAGGEIYAFGKKPDGKDWIIGFRHPREEKTLILKKVSLPAVSTSGDYEKFFIKDGVRYHHILDPSNGYPAPNCASVTVWADNVLDADILSTALFIMGPLEGLALAEKLDNIEALFIYEKNGKLETATTSGVRDIVKL